MSEMDVREMEEANATNALEEMDYSSDVDAMNVDSEDDKQETSEEENDEEDMESDMEQDLSDTIYRTQERRVTKERNVIDVIDPSHFPEDWLTPENPLPPCASLTEPTIYYSSHSCLLSGPHEGNCNILPSLAISTAHGTTTHAPASAAKRSKASRHPPKAEANSLDGLIYLLATKLPRNVKQRVFALLIEAWDNERPWPVKKHNGFGISLARRYFGSVIPRACRDEEAEVMSWPKVSDDESHFSVNSLTNRMFIGQSMRRVEFPKWRSVRAGNQVGALDYFKSSEYAVVQGFARALEHFEGRDSSIGEDGKVEVKNLEHLVYQRRRELGILKEFTAFFWNSVVVEFRATDFHGRSFSGKEIYKSMQPCPASHYAHHSQILHIALNITVDAIPATKKVSENNQQFIRLCRNVNASCGDLNSVVLFVSIEHTEMDLMMKNPLNHKAWVRSVQKLKIAPGGNMEVKLLLLGSEDDLTGSRKQKAKQIMQTQEAWLSNLLIPHTMNERDLEKDGFGLSDLFMEHEHKYAAIVRPVGLKPEKKAAGAAKENIPAKKRQTTSKETAARKKQKIDETQVVTLGKITSEGKTAAAPEKAPCAVAKKTPALDNKFKLSSASSLPASQKKQTVLSPKKAPALDNKIRFPLINSFAAPQKNTGKGKRTASDGDMGAARKKQMTGGATMV